MAVDLHGAPARCSESGKLVGGIRKRKVAVDRNSIVIENDNKSIKSQMTGKGKRLLADTLHKIAIGREYVGIVINDVVAEFGVERTFCDCHSDCVGNALAQRTGRRFDSR